MGALKDGSRCWNFWKGEHSEVGGEHTVHSPSALIIKGSSSEESQTKRRGRGRNRMHSIASQFNIGESTRSHWKVSYNVRLTLARTLDCRKGANSMSITTMNNFMSLFKIQIDGKMHFRRIFRLKRQRDKWPAGHSHDKRIVSSTQSRLYGSSGSSIGWTIHNSRPLLEQLGTANCSGSESHTTIRDTTIAGLRVDDKPGCPDIIIALSNLLNPLRVLRIPNYWGGPVLGAYQLGRVSDLKTGPTHPTSV